MIRVLEEELLDADAGSPAEVASALRSLRVVNRFFGGDRMHTRLLRRVWPQSAVAPAGGSLHILEAASGHADALQTALLRLQRERQIPLRISLLDRSAQHLPQMTAWAAALPQPERIVSDALRIPLPDGSVDVVSCCLFLHHLDEAAAHTYLAEALRVARVAVLVNDLERSRAHYLLARMFSLIDPSRLSRHDGPVSVRQAYTRGELAAILRELGYSFEIERGFLFRFGATIWKRRA